LREDSSQLKQHNDTPFLILPVKVSRGEKRTVPGADGAGPSGINFADAMASAKIDRAILVCVPPAVKARHCYSSSDFVLLQHGRIQQFPKNS
jgi:hypothetical protein